MPHAYTEDQLVEQPAIGLFAEFSWQTAAVSAGVAVETPCSHRQRLPGIFLKNYDRR